VVILGNLFNHGMKLSQSKLFLQSFFLSVINAMWNNVCNSTCVFLWHPRLPASLARSHTHP
jgi:hypothetical protein